MNYAEIETLLWARVRDFYLAQAQGDKDLLKSVCLTSITDEDEYCRMQFAPRWCEIDTPEKFIQYVQTHYKNFDVKCDMQSFCGYNSDAAKIYAKCIKYLEDTVLDMRVEDISFMDIIYNVLNPMIKQLRVRIPEIHDRIMSGAYIVYYVLTDLMGLDKDNAYVTETLTDIWNTYTSR